MKSSTLDDFPPNGYNTLSIRNVRFTRTGNRPGKYPSRCSVKFPERRPPKQAFSYLILQEDLVFLIFPFALRPPFDFAQINRNRIPY